MKYRKTKRYRELERRIKSIEKNLIQSFEKKDVLELGTRELDLCRGYKVLCHAEIEYYFEEIARCLLNESLWLWKNENKVTLPIVGLLGNYEKIDTNDNVSTKIHKIANDYAAQVLKKNHGIKEENLKKIFTNLGIDLSDVDATWLAILSSYGEARGTIAHTSAIVQTPINVRETVESIGRILQGIEAFEIEIQNQTKISLYSAERRQASVTM